MQRRTNPDAPIHFPYRPRHPFRRVRHRLLRDAKRDQTDVLDDLRQRRAERAQDDVLVLVRARLLLGDDAEEFLALLELDLGILEQDLLAARPANDVVAEGEARGPQPLDRDQACEGRETRGLELAAIK